ncbi:MAG TPA: hypothetical protein V6D47_12155 [Oscillatoriaceae cyanobacterium]
MKRSLAVCVALLLTGCGSPLLPSSLGTTPDTSLDAQALGGLPSDRAAHPSVELASPNAYALTSETQAFREALDRTVEPLRRTLASDLLADSTVSAALTDWNSLSASDQLDALTKVETIEAQVMNCQAPPITEQPGAPPQTGLMAYFDASTGDGVGQIVLYPQSIAQGGVTLAIATLVHETRHAAQYQLVQSDQSSPLTGDAHTLAQAYNAAWNQMNAIGSEDTLAYGDYAHLNVEFDAFQTGNEVAAILFGTQYNPLGIGFVDTHYSQSGTPSLDLTTLDQQATGVQLIADVNSAEYNAEQSQSMPSSPYGGGFRQHTTFPRGGYRRRGTGF